MKFKLAIVAAAMAVVAVPSLTCADIIVDYTANAGGEVKGPLNGLAARGTFSIDGTTLTILLENTSTGVPKLFDTADQLLVSIGFNLPGDILFASGNSAIIGPGSIGLEMWSDRGEGDSVAEQWMWTNDGGGDLLEPFAQIISTHSNQGEGAEQLDFNGKKADVGSPWGGIAADPPLLEIPQSQFAVSDSISFTLKLSEEITEDQLSKIANAALIEFGSDARYLNVPAPGALGLLFAAGFIGRRRRR